MCTLNRSFAIIYTEFEHFVERRRNINKIYTFALNSQVGAYVLYCKYCNVFACVQ